MKVDKLQTNQIKQKNESNGKNKNNVYKFITFARKKKHKLKF